MATLEGVGVHVGVNAHPCAGMVVLLVHVLGLLTTFVMNLELWPVLTVLD